MRLACLLLPWLMAGLLCVAWTWSSDHFALAHGLALILWLVAAWLLDVQLRRPAEGLLGWDGQSWSWEAQGLRCVGELRPRLDWQHGLLLEFRPQQGQGLWLWPERRMAPLLWDALRRALYAPAVVPSAPHAQSASQEGGL